MTDSIRISLRYDLRAPAFAGRTHEEIYAACVEQCAWADEQGLDMVILCEHHGVEDGFMSAPLTIAAAVGARTERIMINITAALIPLHDPVRFAEQCAAVQLLTRGRLMFVAGMAYRQEELDMAGVERKGRGKLVEEYIHVMRRAWTGEPFEWRGRTIRVTPKPETPPVIMVGGSTEVAARRAARLGAGYFPAIGDPRLKQIYEEECTRRGFGGGFVVLPSGPGFVHVSDDPERDWERIMPHALHEAQTYHSWQTPGLRSIVDVDARNADDIRNSGVYRVVTPDECVELARANGGLTLHPLMGGLAPEIGWQSLRLFAESVLPRLRRSAT
jgi:alkanesulfonate monooxygenase SsuD/methylene tetrahydromethanopterin reductase-like flavin-dependent oxidoreductase (luciferase family)